MFIVLTGVDYVDVNFNKPNQERLEKVSIEDMKKYIDEDQFAPGSMLPKVEATIKFAEEKPGSEAVITSLENLEQLIESNAGTIITK